MKYPFFASFLIFLLVVRHAIRRNRRVSEVSEKNFWDRESQANSTRRKPLDDLDYVRVPVEDLPIRVLTEDETVSDCIRELQELSQQKIVNLTGYTNTDLKLKYGAPNITLLAEYDANYTHLVQLLQKWADRLWELGEQSAAVRIMEYEVGIRADVGSAYRKLALWYRKNGTPERIEAELIPVAQNLRTASKESILRSLREEALP
ncbi:MAG: hypothetical protein IKS07_07000 [Lachnospiraceae bacterium]|nr:hypothetical protein [Lachnospiraceae bacterium]